MVKYRKNEPNYKYQFLYVNNCSLLYFETILHVKINQGVSITVFFLTLLCKNVKVNSFFKDIHQRY